MNSAGYIFFAVAGGPLALAFFITKFVYRQGGGGSGLREVVIGSLATSLQIAIPGLVLAFRGPDFNFGAKSIAAGLMLVSMIALLMLAVAAYKKFSAAERYFLGTANDRLFAVGALLVTSYGVLWFYASSHLPLQSWDALTFWAPQAQDYLTSVESESQWVVRESHHPWTISMLFLAFPHGGIFAEATHYSSYMWYFLAIEIGLIVWGYSRYCGNTRSISLILVIALFSVPLVENHSLLFGYTEIFLALMLLAGYTLITIGMSERSTLLALAGMVFLVGAVIARNTGLVYSAVSLAALALSYAARRRPIYACLIAAFFIISALAMANFTFRIEYGFLDFGYSEGKHQVYLGGKKLLLKFVDVVSLREVLVEQWWNNVSFSILLIATILASIALWQQSSSVGDYFLIWGTFGILMALFLSLFTEYGYLYAAPGNDTGNSRFHVPVVPLMFLLIARAISAFQHNLNVNALFFDGTVKSYSQTANHD